MVRWLLAYEQRRECHAELDMTPGLSILAGWIAQLYHKPPRAYHSLAAICAANVIGQRMPYAEYLCGWWNHTTEAFNEALFEVVECLECWGETCGCRDADG